MQLISRKDLIELSFFLRLFRRVCLMLQSIINFWKLWFSYTFSSTLIKGKFK